MKRGHHVTNVKATFNGEKTKVTRTHTKGGRRMFVVRIDMRGLSKGTYVARVRYRLAEAPTKFPLSKVHYYRACGGKDSMNEKSIITL